MKFVITLTYFIDLCLSQDTDGLQTLANSLHPSSILSRLLAPVIGPHSEESTPWPSPIGWLRDAHERSIDVRGEYVKLFEALGNAPREALNHITVDATAPEAERSLAQTAMLPVRMLFDFLQIPTRMVTRPANMLLDAERAIFGPPTEEGIRGMQASSSPAIVPSRLVWPFGMPLLGLPPLVVNLPPQDMHLRGASVLTAEVMDGQGMVESVRDEKSKEDVRVEGDELQSFGDELKQEIRQKVWNSWSQSLTQILQEDGIETAVPAS